MLKQKLLNMGKKDKKSKKNNAKMTENMKKVEENDEVKDVLQLFNKLEEMVVDGDPRIREALKQKPGIQNLLRDDSSLFGLTPRSYVGQMQADPPQILAKEGTYTSFRQFNPLSPRSQQVPLQTNNFTRSPRKNIIVPPITIPEHSTLGDTFSNGYHAAFVKQHPDGTLESMRMEQPERPQQQATFQQPANLSRRVPPVPKLQIENIQSSYNVPPTINTNPPVEAHPNSEKSLPNPRYHSFMYDAEGKQTTVQIHMPEDKFVTNAKQRLEQRETTNSTFPLPLEPRLDLAEQSFTFSEAATFPQPATLNVTNTSKEFTHTTSYNKEQKTVVYSTVINEDGGALSCFGCKIRVPKNATKKKFLLQLSILGASETPHKTDRLFNRSLQGENSGSTMIAITPTINVSPTDVELLKPITIQLPTCIAIHSNDENIQKPSQQGETDNHDIKAENIVVKIRNKNTRDVWTEADTEVFRSSDSIIFNTQELGDVGAFYKQSTNDKHALNKRLAIYLYKSSDHRKKQFVSILVTEELPHVIQKGIEGMPAWLEFTDYCSNVTLPEGRNLVFYIEAVDRTLCQTDANKIDIPWENLWSPESVIRKHIHVNLLKRDTPASIQVYVDEGKSCLQAQFLWKTRFQTIHMPDLITVEGNSNDLEVEKPTQGYTEQDLLKKVTWKPESPVSKYVTNKGLLNYATMQ